MIFGSPRRRDVEEILVRCVALARRVAAWDEETRRNVAHLSDTLRIIFESVTLSIVTEVGAGTAVDAEAPGYVVRNVDGTAIRVPYHLLDVLLSGPALGELLAFAAGIRSRDDSVIAISGSSVIAEIVDVISDLDFCEYLAFDSRQPTLADALRHAEQVEEDITVCFMTHLFEMRYDAFQRKNVRVDYAYLKRPWSPPPSQNPKMLRVLPRARKAKLDYLTSLSQHGLLVATNIVLLAGGDHDHTLLESFTPQEAPVWFEGSWVPRALHDPVELGRYIEFLCDEVSKLAATKPAKAGKRAIALARLLTRDKDADGFADNLKSRDVVLRAALAARLEIARAVARLDDDALRNKYLSAAVETMQALCRSARDPELRRLSDENSKQLDDRLAWVDNLERYMQTKVVDDAALEPDLIEFVRSIREQIDTRAA